MTPKLSDRVAALTGHDRGADAEISAALRIEHPQSKGWAQNFPKWEACLSRKGRVNMIGNVNGNGDYIAAHFKSPAYTASLDAAVTLFEAIPDTIPSCPRACCVAALRKRGL